MLNVFEELAASLYPKQCPVCGEILPLTPGSRAWIHKSCYEKLTPVREPVCKKCGKPLSSLQQEYCADCLRYPHHFEGGRSLWRYDRFSSQLVFSYKYGRRQDLAPGLGAVCVREAGSWIRSLPVSQIVPVPISRSRMCLRGFNQAQLLAEQIGWRLKIPAGTGLYRRHATKPQKELGRKERMRNLASAFYADPECFRGAGGVLLVDDIYTTGSTVELCTRALLAAGAGRVWFFTLCIGEYDGPMPSVKTPSINKFA